VVVGFDLDMTLVDSAEAIVGSVLATADRFGVEVRRDQVVPSLGLPLDLVFPYLLPGVAYQEALDSYRAHFVEHGIAVCRALPGARESLAAVRALGGRVVVVTARHGHIAEQILAALGLEADVVVGERFGPQKSGVLRDEGASVYVGDHPADVEAARGAAAFAVGVPTGVVTAAELAAAGPDVMLPDLTAFPAWLEAHVLDARLAALDEALRAYPSLVVAFSGGADSAFLLAAAVRALGADAVVAATAVSPSLASGELDPARAFAASLGVRHVEPLTDELSHEGYRANGPDRCYFCKSELVDVLGPVAAEAGGGRAVIATGTNADDVVAGFRPGIRAAHERGAVTPLADAGLTKAQVRTASARWGLPTATKPQAACLASRLAYGVEVTPTGLARVDRAEIAVRAALEGAGVPVVNLRVRDLGGDAARIEIDADIVAPVLEDPMLLAVVVVAATGAGFRSAALDPRGFRSGAMNEALVDPEAMRR
jgi:uncharacterized protein